jgi:hypothetical protein
MPNSLVSGPRPGHLGHNNNGHHDSHHKLNQFSADVFALRPGQSEEAQIEATRVLPPPLPSATLTAVVPLPDNDFIDQGDPQQARPIRPPTAQNWSANLPALTVTALTIGALWIGWTSRNDGHLTPEHGTGYWLGIAGASALVLLLLYPLRKRMRLLRVIGSVGAWFRIHMLLGLLGPVLILFHANFKFGSTNSNVAMISMLTVAISGIAGRYLYGKIHLGLYGRRAALNDVVADVDVLQLALGDVLPGTDHFTAQLKSLTQDATRPRTGIIASTGAWFALSHRIRRCRRLLRADVDRMIATQGTQLGWSWRTRRQHRQAVRRDLESYFVATKRAAAFAVFERLFALWHVLHLPLFVLLIITMTLHVIAVHTF